MSVVFPQLTDLDDDDTDTDTDTDAGEFITAAVFDNIFQSVMTGITAIASKTNSSEWQCYIIDYYKQILKWQLLLIHPITHCDATEVHKR